jgi:hypothetical protein
MSSLGQAQRRGQSGDAAANDADMLAALLLFGGWLRIHSFDHCSAVATG